MTPSDVDTAPGITAKETTPVHIGRMANLLNHVDAHVVSSENPKLREDALALASIVSTFIYPGEPHNNAPTPKNALTDLVVAMPYAEKYNLTVPTTDQDRRSAREGTIDAYRSSTHPSEGDAWEPIAERLDKGKLLKKFWQEQTADFKRDPESVKPLSLQDGPTLEIKSIADTLIENQIDKQTVLALAAQTLHKLTKARVALSKGETVEDADAILALADEAEGLYEPLCDLISFDLLLSAIHDNAVLVRHYLAGNHRLIEKLRVAYDKYGDAATLNAHMEAIREQCIGVDGGLDLKIIHEGPSDYVFLGGLVDTASAKGKDYKHDHEEHARTTVKFRGRVKSFGSFVEKCLPRMMEIGENSGLMDIFGYTLIPAADEDVGGIYKDVMAHLNNLKEQDLIEFQAAPSRKEALHVKGTEEFIGSVTDNPRRCDDGSDPLDGHIMDVKIDSKGFNVAKVTIYLTSPTNPDLKLPVEIQVLSQTVRDGLRTGAASHYLFKLSKVKNRKFSEEEIASYTTELRRIRDHLLS